jgi:hypothetical protein
MIAGVSWDVYVMRMPSCVSRVRDIPDDYQPPSMGTRAEVIDRIRARVPSVDFADPAWGVLEGGAFSIEFNVGKDPVTSLMLHVRGGDEAIGVIHEVAKALGCDAIETGDGEVIDFGSPQAAGGFARWRAYRDQIARSKT